MYISKLELVNYRNFGNLSIMLHDGLNIILGQNNAGKSNLLKALRIIFDGNISKKLNIDDLYSSIQLEELKKASPKISITVQFTQSSEEKLHSDELASISDWLIQLNEPYIAQIQYEFFLPETEEENYKLQLSNANNEQEARNIISNNFIRLYTNKVWIGNPNQQQKLDSESISKFDFQFLDAIRDVERDMFSGKTTLLKKIIQFFIDYEIKSDLELSREDRDRKLQEKQNSFSLKSSALLQELHERLKAGNKEINSYAQNIGASFEKEVPTFQGVFTESELYSVLQLMIQQQTGVTIPVANNGLGYNNLVFMALLLAKMQIDSDGSYLGGNAKIFPVLAIEEPEAHLHPTMQFHFLQFLKQNMHDKRVKQVFITTHSTHITAHSSLDEIICLQKENNKTSCVYPKKVFTNEASKQYVQRFLDATKSNMLFAEKIILVEGIAEQLLMPIFAKYIGYSLEEHHVDVINIGGRYFQNFLQLFAKGNNGLHRKVACITDCDTTRKEKNVSDASFTSCYPYEYNNDSAKYEYAINPSLPSQGTYSENINFFTQEPQESKTFEYQLALDNLNTDLLFVSSVSNIDELTKIKQHILEGKSLGEVLPILRSSKENERIQASLLEANSKIWSEDALKKALYASRYLNSVSKGETALEISSVLDSNFSLKDTEEYKEFVVPQYIVKAIKWICGE